MRGYSIREIGNGWLAGGDGFHDYYTVEPFPETYCSTLGEAFELIRKHAKKIGDLVKRETP